MGRKITALFIFFMLFTAAASVAQIRVGYMSTQEVLSMMPERPEIEKKLAAMVQEKQGELEQKAREFQNSVADYQQNYESMSDEQRRSTEEDLATMEQELSAFQQSVQVEVQQERVKLLQPVYDRIDKAVTAVAEELDLDFVLNQATNMGDHIIYFSADENLNITSRVLEQVKK